MAIRTKSASDVAKKWSEVTPQRAAYYADGVRNPRVDWAQATTASETNYKLAVTAAANAGRFGKGVAKAGSAKWQTNAVEKGTNRFGSGVQAGATAYASGIQGVLDTISSTTLPARYPKGDPRNIERVSALANALHKKKLA